MKILISAFLILSSVSLFAQGLSPVMVQETEFQNIKFPKPSTVTSDQDSLYMTVLEMYVNYPKRPNKIAFEFPKLNVATTYAVTDQLISYFTKYYYETGNPYFELNEVSNGKYVLSVCTFAPVKNLRSYIKVQVDGKVITLKAMPKME